MINLDDTRHLQEIVLQLSAANDLLNRIAVSLEAIAGEKKIEAELAKAFTDAMFGKEGPDA